MNVQYIKEGVFNWYLSDNIASMKSSPGLIIIELRTVPKKT